jgi:hypothetical protein
MRILMRVVSYVFVRVSNSIYESLGFLQSHTANYFLTYHLRPKRSAQIHTNSAREVPPNQLAIIVQGPLKIEDNFTVETIKLYKQIFKGARIILSTWESEDQSSIEEARSCGAEVIASEIPKSSGYSHINYQIKSTMNGLSLAKDLGYKYSIKTRSDQRLYRHDLFDFFVALLKTFPLREGLPQHERLVVSSFKTCKYRLYSLTDMMMFGDTRDLLSYWDTDYYQQGIVQYLGHDSQQTPPIIHNTPIITEIYLTLKYLEKLGIEPLWTLQHWWDICRDYFCVVDSTSIDQYWCKYKQLYEYWFIKDYTRSNPRSLTFADWLQLYANTHGHSDQLSEQELYEYRDGNMSGWEQYTDSTLYTSFGKGHHPKH